ncbi:two-component system response regulator [Thiomicrorhabdus immobilis]|uniref:Two-component system response regulator n=1 Tax=Thiomicrorhabdus immobilis TaxID=2791037 RepID=A0ABM7MB53_9GAMM|nr:HD domain-containing phosphohydrolase [Thiomicrorhabdus immobilis]BCN92508.1 two-component system response regulator [Thiomicrorhabdus immobilis]
MNNPNVKRKTILCVDDTPANLSLLNESLKNHYKLKLVNSGKKAISLLERSADENLIDLILLDVMMPEMDGYEVCKMVKSHPSWCHIPIIFITAKSSPEDEQRALREGGSDFIPKPINPDVLLSRIRTHLELSEYHKKLREDNANLEQMLNARLSDIYQLQQATLTVMISLAEFRDEETGNHIKRTQTYIQLLAEATNNSYPDLGLDENYINLIVQAAPLHDVGKITTPDHILLKPGKLTADEFEIMKQHAQKGADILRAAANEMGSYGGFLEVAQEIAISHHEKWDGNGYPKGLAGENIPISGRLMAVVDVYDALRSTRPYKKAFSHQEAMEIIIQGANKHFDARLVQCFQSIEQQVSEIAEQLKD